MSTERGGKRQATTPVGGTFKDPRREARQMAQQANHFDAMGDYEASDGKWMQVTNRTKIANTNQNRSNNIDFFIRPRAPSIPW